MAGALPPESRGVAAGLTAFLDALAAGDRPRSCSQRLEEFDGSCFAMESDKRSPGVLLLSFAQAHPLPPEAPQAVRDTYAPVAELMPEAREGFQLTLEVSLPALLALPEAERLARVQQLARLRLVAAGASLQRVFRALAAGACEPEALTVLARPRAPFFVCTSAGGADVVLPVWQRGDANRTLTAAFVQEFAEARRAEGLTATPQCTVTHPGQAPPAQLSAEQRRQLGDFRGECLTLAVRAEHVATPAARDALAWALLTLPAFLDLHLRSFKAFLHARMRRSADALLQEVAAARGRPKQPVRLAPRPQAHGQAAAVPA